MTRQDLAMAGRAAWYLSVFWILVRIRDVRDAEARIRAGARAPSTRLGMSPLRLVAIVRRVSRLHPLRPRCLEQALTVATLAAGAGHPASVRIGVRRGSAGIEAHAWAVIAGQTLDSRAGDFTPLVSLHGGLGDRVLSVFP